MTAGAAAAAIAARKASGLIVRVDTAEFVRLLGRARGGAVIHAVGGVFVRRHRYLLSYKGFGFFTSTSDPLVIPGDVEEISARRIWAP